MVSIVKNFRGERQSWIASFLALLLATLLVACADAELVMDVERTVTPTANVITTERVTTEQETIVIYLDPHRPIDERVEDLLARMSLAEKIGQMTLVEKDSIREGDIRNLYIGAILSGGGGRPRGNNTAENWLEMVNGFKQEALETPLRIPLLYGVDAVHGHNNVKDAVIFPHNIGLGATRNPELVRRIGQATAEAVAATGIDWNYAPVIAVPQDIRWGRTYEGYAEDTHLVSTLGVAFIQGLQGEALNAPTSILATPKHFVGDGGAMWGTSRTGDYQIDQGDMQVDEATVRQKHLPPYVAAIDAGALSVMASFSSWNGTRLHASTYLINDVLKEELGFQGFVVSDWGAVDQIDENYYEAVVKAINAGIDMNMVPQKYDLFIQALTAGVENGDVPMERIDDAVRRILRAKFELGLFEQPLGDPDLLHLIDSNEHRLLARETVRQSLVLLQNERDALPLSRENTRIYVAGEAANNIGLQCGGWTIEWQGRSGNITEGTTIREAIEATVSATSTLHYNRFGKFEHVTDGAGNPIIADVGIVVVGEQPYAEGAGDNNALYLTEAEVGLIERVGKQSEEVVVILLSGRPLIITEQLPLADAWVAAWLPGTEAAGIADVLFGDYPFTGKLPFTWPRSMAQIPANSAAMPASGDNAPLFPYGHGLTTQTSN